MFKVGHVYTHQNMLDVCMLVARATTDKFGWDLRVRWFKKNGLDLGATDDIYIKMEDVAKWRISGVE